MHRGEGSSHAATSRQYTQDEGSFLFPIRQALVIARGIKCATEGKLTNNGSIGCYGIGGPSTAGSCCGTGMRVTLIQGTKESVAFVTT